MKEKHIKNVLIGVGATSALIGLGLLGLLGFAVGVYLKTGLPVLEHALFDPAVNCLYASLATAIILIVLSPAKDKTVM